LGLVSELCDTEEKENKILDLVEELAGVVVRSEYYQEKGLGIVDIQ